MGIQKSGYDVRTHDSVKVGFHREVAEKKLGRKLGKFEVVHHLDTNRSNNNEDNIIVLRSKKYHGIVHGSLPVELVQTKDGSHIVIVNQKKCDHCGGLYEPDSGIKHQKYCTVKCCVAAALEKSKCPTPEELKELVWTIPAEHVAKMFDVSGTTIKNWCRKLDISKPPRGFWEQQKKST
jgi:hypothetical protein